MYTYLTGTRPIVTLGVIFFFFFLFFNLCSCRACLRWLGSSRRLRWRWRLGRGRRRWRGRIGRCCSCRFGRWWSVGRRKVRVTTTVFHIAIAFSETTERVEADLLRRI